MGAHKKTPLILMLSFLLSAAATVATELRGRVLDEGGNPVAAAVVSATVDGRSFRTACASDGAFLLALPPEVQPPLTLSASADGFSPAQVVVDAADRSVELLLARRTIFSGEVEVSGTRATAGETPVTLTNIDREQIERGSWGQDVPMFLGQVPGFNAYSDNGQGIGYSYFTLRGFDMRRVAVSLNGVPLNDAHSHSVFFVDLTDFLATTGDIQVQRGVGTSLYGNSAIGGSVDLRTRAPLNERRLRVSAMYGSFNTQKWSMEYDTGLVDDSWAATFRWSKIRSDGYRDQSWVDMWNYFAAIEHYGERSTTRIVLFGGPEDTHLAYEGIPQPWLDGEITGNERTDRRHNPLTFENEIDHFFQPHYQLINSWQISSTATFTNTFYYFEGDGYYEQYKAERWMPEYDLDPFPGADGEIIEVTDLVRRREVTEWDAGWIPHLEWLHGDGHGTLSAGLATRFHRGQHVGSTIWAQYYPPDLAPNHPYYDYELEKLSFQPFVQETWRFNHAWSVLAGLSWTNHTYKMDEDQRNGVEVEETYSFLLPRLGVNFRPLQDWSFFANISRGGREPAFRDIYDPQDYWFGDPNQLEPEDLIDYELGARHTWHTGFAALNFYWLDFDNAIVWAGGLDNNGVPVTANGAVVDQKGVELEAAWTPVPRWAGRLAVAYNDATFDEFIEYDWDGGIIDYSGNAVAANPEWMANLELTGGFGPVDLMLTIRYVSEFFIDNTEDMRKNPEIRDDPEYIHRVNPSYTVADLAVSVDLGTTVADLIHARSARLDLRFNNLSDALYTSFGYYYPEAVWIPAATRGVYAGVVLDW